MAVDLARIQEAAATVHHAIEVYRALSDLEEVIVTVGNLEANRLALEPKVAALKEEVALLEARNSTLEDEWNKQNLALNAARAASEEMVRAELDQARTAAEENAKRYEEELRAGMSELTEQRMTLEADVAQLSGSKAQLAAQLESLRVEIDIAQRTLSETNAAVSALKSQLAGIAGKL